MQYGPIEVFGVPKGQPRVKAAARKFGAQWHARVWTPKTAAPWKQAVIMACRPYKPDAPIDAPVLVLCKFWMPRTTGTRKLEKMYGTPTPHIGTPDLDNCWKAVVDALQDDGWFRDDSRVYFTAAEKLYADKARLPGATITITTRDSHA